MFRDLAPGAVGIKASFIEGLELAKGAGYEGVDLNVGEAARLAQEHSIEWVRDQVAFVNTVGAYFDAPALLEQIATRSQVLDGARRPWQPSEHTLRMFKLALMEALPDSHDRILLERLEAAVALAQQDIHTARI